jgi:16S rRNA A1518/A1519 N6-dimethyltransferase RsmA/KsgA/DIM1 with predicted DNA glycosylase/AP lyase activity
LSVSYNEFHKLKNTVVKLYVLFIVGDLTGKYVIEVGPGPGGITRACLAANAKQVLVIEKDPRFIPSLKLLQEASGGPDRLRINIGDCLHYNVESKMLLISILCILIRPVLK